ncbi:uncharacterized protein LOC118645935 [Monomorium pharaonis]|uniref:uncharacterized protein LOC118645935 n=1 Tax=Monomorium pharaonis TaxID=307658 RepID=UPI001747D02A|nr:uncharacterized protein LOC118645935 [Monomorium pharaonis]
MAESRDSATVVSSAAATGGAASGQQQQPALVESAAQGNEDPSSCTVAAVEENTKTVVTSEVADKEQIKTQINGDIGMYSAIRKTLAILVNPLAVSYIIHLNLLFITICVFIFNRLNYNEDIIFISLSRFAIPVLSVFATPTIVTFTCAIFELVYDLIRIHLRKHVKLTVT